VSSRLALVCALACVLAPVATLVPATPSASAAEPATVPAAALAGTTSEVTHTASVDVRSFPAVHDIQLPQFDSQSGTLLLTEVRLHGHVSGDVNGSLQNLSTTQSKTLSSFVDANISLQGELATYHANAHDAKTFTLAPGEKTDYTLSNSGTFDTTSTDPSVLAGFVGNGFVTYPVTTNIDTQVSGPAPYLSTGVALGAADVTITYVYSTPPPDVVQTESVFIYQCVNGAPSTTPVAGTVADSTEPIAATASPIVDASVAAGDHATTAVVGPEWMFTACGQSGVSIADDQHASQTITVPVGGHADAIYYVQPVPPPPPPPSGGETAWAGGGAGGGSYNPDGGGSWATYVKGPSGTWNVYAGQTTLAGTVTISSKGVVTVNLAGATFVAGGTNLQIQGYSSPPSGNPSPGQFDNQFTCTGTTCTATVPLASYYGIHLDVGVTPQTAALTATRQVYHRALSVTVTRELLGWRYDARTDRWVNRHDNRWYAMPAAYRTARTFKVTSNGAHGVAPRGAEHPRGLPASPRARYRYVVGAASRTDRVATWSAPTGWLAKAPATPAGTHGFGWVVDPRRAGEGVS
jgi:hypothetical protein